MNFSSPYVPQAPPISFLFNWPQEYLVRVKSRKPSLISHLQSPVIYCLLGGSALPSTRISNNLSTFSKFHDHTKQAKLYFVIFQHVYSQKAKGSQIKTGTIFIRSRLAHMYMLPHWLLQQSLPLTSCLHKHTTTSAAELQQTRTKAAFSQPPTEFEPELVPFKLRPHNPT